MEALRWLLALSLWLGAVELRLCCHRGIAEAYAFMQLRRGLLTDPGSAKDHYCAMLAPVEGETGRCAPRLDWYDAEGLLVGVCEGPKAARREPMPLRRYVLSLDCSIAFRAITLHLPLLATTIFR